MIDAAQSGATSGPAGEVRARLRVILRLYKPATPPIQKFPNLLRSAS